MDEVHIEPVNERLQEVDTCRVFDAAVFLAELEGVDGIELEIIRAGALLHDIKKFGAHAEYSYTRDDHQFTVRELID